MPVPMAGIISRAVVRKMTLRPPAMRMKKDAGMRIVAPGQAGNRGQREQFLLAEGKAQVGASAPR
jgi:hypothetical protein